MGKNMHIYLVCDYIGMANGNDNPDLVQAK